MPLDPTDLISSDKPAVVVDIGTKYTKFGFSGEDSPRFIIPTEVTTSVDLNIRAIFSYKDKADLRSLLVDFVQMLFFNYALTQPKDKRVVIVESLLCPTLFRDVLASVLFDHFEVGSILFLPSHVVALYTLGINTALVLDVGYEESVLIPVYEGIPMLKAWQALPLASKAVERNIKDRLTNKIRRITANESEIISYDSAFPTDSVLENIKVKGCFVTTLERSKSLASGEKLEKEPTGFQYKINGDKVVQVDASLRELSFEVLFERDLDQMSIPTMVLDAICKCPIDARKPLAENILVIGGTATAPGFKSRLSEEIKELSVSPTYADKLSAKTFKYHAPPAMENYVAWLGASICAATNTILTKSLTRESFRESQGRKVPDWVSLATNQSA